MTKPVLTNQVLLEVPGGIVRERIAVVAVPVSVAVRPLGGVVRESVHRVTEAIVVAVRVSRVRACCHLVGIGDPVVVVVRVLIVA